MKCEKCDGKMKFSHTVAIQDNILDVFYCDNCGHATNKPSKKDFSSVKYGLFF